MKQFYTLLALSLFFQLTVHGQCTNLFFSEYIEGSSNNKALEIYNPTSNPIDLGTYKINRYNNGGSGTPSGVFEFPSGKMLATGEVYVIANPDADSAGILVKADTTSSITFYNGDDAIELVDTVTGNAIDIIGVIGEDPGTNWPVGAGATSEFTLVRNPNVNDGQTDWTLGALEWDVYPQNTFDSLGTHSINSCSTTVVPPVVSFSVASDNILESGGTTTVSVNISNLTSNVDFEIIADASSTTDINDGSVSNLGTYSFAQGGNDTSIVLTFTINDDGDIEGDEIVVLKLINVTNGVTVSIDTYTLTILDDDVVQNNPCGDLFFSEYIEGSSNNKAIEIFNPTDAAIHLGKYHVNRYNGGATEPSGTFKFPEGLMLGAGEVYVIANSQADSAGVLAQADTTSSITFYNGDDAMELIDTTTNTAIDIIGVIGEDPGTAWPVGNGFTNEFTLVRKASVHEGYTNWAASSQTWDVYAQDSFAFLGNHVMESCDTVPDVCDGVTILVSLVVTNESVSGAADGSIDATITGGTLPYTSYTWSNGDDTEDIADLMPGSYTLTVTDSNGCSGSATAIVLAGSVGLNDIPSLKAFNVYPNPVADIMNVELQFANTSQVQLEITDIVGRNVFSLQPETISSKIYTINPELPTGIYFLKVMVEGHIAVEPFVVK
ncbi:MAG: lamin tail domain-containing protein [Bacteroidetes bacterium]|nr:lamin tail domain-containing protein [Bacteroidota bacterium]